ncbi:DMT family transporter [Polycladidibacter stylochi]|uniref:DMT family transporter n=1 Tax=Polycladidibacter stylochi TaxID=1807766 RepID=UPI0009EC888B|nr:DMT family transporter [Pseudovibrio stylochi]
MGTQEIIEELEARQLQPSRNNASKAFALTKLDYGLYAATVLAWGFSWYFIKLQAAVPSELAIFWRFLLAALIMGGWAYWGGHRLVFSIKEHASFAIIGALLFSINFMFFYNGSSYLPSGLVSVIFSLASVINLALGFLLFRQRQDKKVLIGGLLGFAGIALMFYPQIMQTGLLGTQSYGLLLCFAGTLCFCFGNMVSSKMQSKQLSVVSSSFYGMLYGSFYLACYCLWRGTGFNIPMDFSFLASLIYLVVVASVVAFGSYLTLLGRIGSARAGYATVMFPVIALSVSTLLEGYTWTLPAFVGLSLVLFGNQLVLRYK